MSRTSAGLASALLLLAALVGAADTPAGGFVAGGDPAYRPVESAAPQPLDGGGLRSPEEMEAFVDGFVGGELEAYHVAGMTVAVVKDGQLFFAKGYGFADVDRQVRVEADKTLRAGAHLLREGAKPSTLNDQGYVSSAGFSPTLGHDIALAFLKSGRERYGERIVVWDRLGGTETIAEVCHPVFVDPGNSRLNS